MKKIEQIKYQNQTRPDEFFYSTPKAPTKEVDGVTFIAVTRQPITQQTQTLHWIRKDSVKRV